MKLKSISGIVCYVKDIDKTAKFYEALGFRFGNQESEYLTVYVNWFWIEFRKGAKSVAQDNGQATYISVEDVDLFYKELLKTDIKPESEPKDTSSGKREFIVVDPDGYKLAFFQKL